MRARWFVLLSLLLFAAALLAMASLGGRGSAPDKPRYVREHQVSVPADARTVRISTTMPMPSSHARRLSAMLEKGRMPQGSTTGEVISDTECTPGADSISRCRNEMLLADGSTMILRHPHNMAYIPCLAPGETVRLVPTGI